ncbi:MAG: hypothetical protein VW683_11600 [Betaproteobacteria bacterium]|jgi:hypothetical protein
MDLKTIDWSRTLRPQSDGYNIEVLNFLRDTNFGGWHRWGPHAGPRKKVHTTDARLFNGQVDIISCPKSTDNDHAYAEDYRNACENQVLFVNERNGKIFHVLDNMSLNRGGVYTDAWDVESEEFDFYYRIDPVLKVIYPELFNLCEAHLDVIRPFKEMINGELAGEHSHGGSCGQSHEGDQYPGGWGLIHTTGRNTMSSIDHIAHEVLHLAMLDHGFGHSENWFDLHTGYFSRNDFGPRCESDTPIHNFDDSIFGNQPNGVPGTLHWSIIGSYQQPHMHRPWSNCLQAYVSFLTVFDTMTKASDSRISNSLPELDSDDKRYTYFNIASYWSSKIDVSWPAFCYTSALTEQGEALFAGIDEWTRDIVRHHDEILSLNPEWQKRRDEEDYNNRRQIAAMDAHMVRPFQEVKKYWPGFDPNRSLSDIPFEEILNGCEMDIQAPEGWEFYNKADWPKINLRPGYDWDEVPPPEHVMTLSSEEESPDPDSSEEESPDPDHDEDKTPILFSPVEVREAPEVVVKELWEGFNENEDSWMDDYGF